MYSCARPGKTSIETSRSPEFMKSFTKSALIDLVLDEHITCRSLTKALKSPGLLFTSNSMASTSYEIPSDLSTRRAILRKASLLARSKLMVTNSL